MSNKKIIVDDKFKKEVNTDTDPTIPSVNKSVILNLNKKKEDKKAKDNGTMTGSLVNDILKLIKN